VAEVAPSPVAELEVPSPQSADRRLRVMFLLFEFCDFDMFRVRITFVIVAPSGMLPTRSNAIKPRLIGGWALAIVPTLPTKNRGPEPLLLEPSDFSISELSLLGLKVITV